MADPSRGYGAHFWLGVPSGPDAPVSALPAGSLQAAGHEGQFVTIVPSHQAVIVRLGRTRYSDAWDHPAFVRAVLDRLPPSAPRHAG
jgi:CubicO group peptidase (beta-lactamase class C family)